MGAAASVVPDYVGDDSNRPKEFVLRRLPDAIEECLYVHEKFPLIIDPTEQAGRFLKYQSGSASLSTKKNQLYFMLSISTWLPY